MKIKCTEYKLSATSKGILDNSRNSNIPFPLIKGKEYIVYAIGEIEGTIWYCICDESYFLYPVWRPFSLFEITDNRLSKYWVFGFDNEEKKKVPIISFPEWIQDECFYTDLVEGDSSDRNAIIFRKYKELMDLEFPDSSVSEIAQLGDNEWLICPTCIDGWQSSTNRDALVKCPKCQKVMHNPRYKP